MKAEKRQPIATRIKAVSHRRLKVLATLLNISVQETMDRAVEELIAKYTKEIDAVERVSEATKNRKVS